MIKKLTKKEFETKYPKISTYDAKYDPMPVFLENGVILLSGEWNGEVYTESVTGKSYRPVYKNSSEQDTVELKLADGKKIKAPKVVDISALGCLDEMEYELWNVIEDYMKLFGIQTDDDVPDWATVKAVQNKIIDVFANAGVSFNFLTDEQTAEVQYEIIGYEEL